LVYIRLSFLTAKIWILSNSEYDGSALGDPWHFYVRRQTVDLREGMQGDNRHMNQSALPITIRNARLSDVEAITEIYNEAILTTTATFDTLPKSISERLEWLKSHGERHPVIVAELDGTVLGWASLSRWSERSAYEDTAETSFYVKSGYRSRGVGRKLKEAIIGEAQRLKFHTLIARITEGSDVSLHLNDSFGFVHVGTLKEVGRKFGRLLDVHILQKML